MQCSDKTYVWISSWEKGDICMGDTEPILKCQKRRYIEHWSNLHKETSCTRIYKSHCLQTCRTVGFTLFIRSRAFQGGPFQAELLDVSWQTYRAEISIGTKEFVWLYQCLFLLFNVTLFFFLCWYYIIATSVIQWYKKLNTLKEWRTGRGRLTGEISILFFHVNMRWKIYRFW